MSSSWSQSPQIRETFPSKDKTDIVPLGLTPPNHHEDVSKPYVSSSNTKQNIRVYKFKNFPPEEIRYCPYCEVELLPNSIRRYRLGYIEFVSPVTHIWYTANSIPLLLNLSKTMIEGIASCHEALSSGFPPVYKWSYNGESPTSWTFQMQPLKLPINSVPKINKTYTIQKKSYSTEILLRSNSITYQNYKQSFKIWTPSFRIIPSQVTSENYFTIYEKRIKSPFMKNAKTNRNETISKQKSRELLDNNNLRFLNPSINAALDLSDLNDNNFSFRKKKTHKENVEKSFLWADSPYLADWKDISYEFKSLWMFKYLSGKSLPKNSSWFQSVLGSADFRSSRSEKTGPETTGEAIGRNSNQVLAKATNGSNQLKKTNALHTKQYFKTPSLDDDLSVTLNSQNSNNYTFLNQKKMAKQFLFICLLRYNYFNYFFSINQPYLSCNSRLFNSPIKSFLRFHPERGEVITQMESDNKKTSWFTPYKKKFKVIRNNRQTTVLNILNEITRGSSLFSQIPKKVDFDPSTATEYEKKREWLKLEGFFEDPSNKKLPDTSQASVFESSNTDPSSFYHDNIEKFNSEVHTETQASPDVSPQAKRWEGTQQEENTENQKHIKSWNETEKKNENVSESLDNLSLPLVLPFLGKNPDNIEFQSNYSNHEHFHIDPLRFIIDLFSTQHIWGNTNFDLNHDKNSHKLETKQNLNQGVSLDQKQYNDFFEINTSYLNWISNSIWNNLSICYNHPITLLNNKLVPNILYNNQTIQEKHDLINSPHALKELKWNFSLFSSYEQIEKTDFWPSFNPFYEIGGNWFSKTYPFLPGGSQVSMFKDFFNHEADDSKNPKTNSLPVQQWYPNTVQTELWSNNSNFTNYRKNYEDCFRKLGRNAYYFKLEQMTRLENAFLKNLFYRNKFHKTSVLKNGLFVLPFISSSTFYSINNNHKIIFKINQTKKLNQNFMIGKRTRSLFGFHLNVYGFEFLESYLPKIKYLPFFFKTGNEFFSLIMKYEFFSNHVLNIFRGPRVTQGFLKLNSVFKPGYFTWFIEIATALVFSKKNLKNSLWPLKSNTKNSQKKLYINNFDKVLHKNVENNIYRLSLYPKSTLKNNFLNKQKPMVINFKIKKQESSLVGKPVSIVYDFLISRSSSLMKNTHSASVFEKNLNTDQFSFYNDKTKMFKTKRLENESQ